jgi:hypothetical protein
VRLALLCIDRPGFAESDLVVVTLRGGVFLNGLVVGELREVHSCTALYELLPAGGVWVVDVVGDRVRVFGRAEAAIELAALAKQDQLDGWLNDGEVAL